MSSNPERASLHCLAGEIFKQVSHGATPEQWAQWLRVPLEHAAADGNIGLFNALIEAGADGSAGWRGCHGRTLFDAAAVGGSADVVSALVLAGAQPDLNVVSASSERSALYAATKGGHEAAAKRLVLAGANVHFWDPVDFGNVLAEAVRGGHEQLVNSLLEAGASLDSCDCVRLTPLHHAAMSGHEKIACALLEKGADKDALDLNGSSPLMRAACGGHLPVVDSLLAAGADISLRDMFGRSALDRAVLQGHIGVLKSVVAVACEADINSQNEEGWAVMHFAAFCDESEAIDALVEAGGDIELGDEGFETPICQAASNCACKSMLTLLRHGASMDVQLLFGEYRSDNDSLLHRTCLVQRNGLEAVVDLLLRWGADETALNYDDKTPAQVLEEDRPRSLQCSPEEVERTRLLLARAPAYRTWRRRCWLVMLRSRASKARRDPERGGIAAGSRGKGEGCKAVKIAGVGDRAGRGKADSGLNAVGISAEDDALSGLVASLLGLELEGVFRKVVGFL